MSQAITLRPADPKDVPAISALHAEAFGPGRYARTAYRVREGTPSVTRFCKVAETAAGELIAAVRFTPVRIGDVGGFLLLGPLAVATTYANQGHGRALIVQGLDAARAAGIGLVLLVGDQPYYGRLGFQVVPAGQIMLPGPVDPQRILAAELREGALAGAKGLVTSDA